MSKLWRDFYEKTVDDTNKQEAFEKAFSSGWECKDEFADLYNKQHKLVTGKFVDNPLLECEVFITEFDFNTYDAVG